MSNEKMSMTALVVAFGRAHHTMNDEPKIFNDFLARDLIENEEFAYISKQLAGYIKLLNPEHADEFKSEAESLKWMVQVLVASPTLSRSAYAEDMLKKHIEQGINQYVILGAGLDTFSLREPKLLEKIKVFEIDHPNMQSIKKDRINKLGKSLSPNLHFIPVDFSDNSFKETLLANQYNKTDKSFYSWLGVTYYLKKEDIISVLKEISANSERGSLIVFDYGDLDFYNPAKTSRRATKMIHLVKTLGEPMITGFDYNEIEEILDNCGFEVVEHLVPKDIQERYFKDRTDLYTAFENINYIMAKVK